MNMKKVFIMVILLFFLPVATFSSGCINGKDPTYDPGRIYVDFEMNVTLENATKVLDSYNLTYGPLYEYDDGKGNTFYETIAVVPEGKEKYYAELLTQHESIRRAYLLYNDN